MRSTCPLALATRLFSTRNLPAAAQAGAATRTTWPTHSAAQAKKPPTAQDQQPLSGLVQRAAALRRENVSPPSPSLQPQRTQQQTEGAVRGTSPLQASLVSNVSHTHGASAQGSGAPVVPHARSPQPLPSLVSSLFNGEARPSILSSLRGSTGVFTQKTAGGRVSPPAVRAPPVALRDAGGSSTAPARPSSENSPLSAPTSAIAAGTTTASATSKSTAGAAVALPHPDDLARRLFGTTGPELRRRQEAERGSRGPSASRGASAARVPAAGSSPQSLTSPAAQQSVAAFAKIRAEFELLRTQQQTAQLQSHTRREAPTTPQRDGATGDAATAGGRPTGTHSRVGPNYAARSGSASTGSRPGAVGYFRPGPGGRRTTLPPAKLAAAPRVPPRGRVVEIKADGLTVRELAERMGSSLPRLRASLVACTGDASLASSAAAMIDADVAAVIVLDAGQVPRVIEDRRRDAAPTRPPPTEDLAAKGVPHRAPIVTVMGHVDHGKTTLLDALRGSHVAEREAGGITQGIAAFSVSLSSASSGVGDRRSPGGKTAKSTALSERAATTRVTSPPRAMSIDGGGGGSAAVATGPVSSAATPSHVRVMTFLDTPGHALFASMRARGSAVTDVVVLVVDGRDGIMPQTRECVELVLSTRVACVVAVTKCDAVADTARAVAAIAQSLLTLGLATEAHGGDSPIVPISAKTGAGLSELKAAIALQAEMLDLRAARDVPGEAVVLDARSEKGSGVVLDAVVRWGVLRIGDYVVAGTEHGRVRALFSDAATADAADAKARRGGGGGTSVSAAPTLTPVTEAPPGTPVRVLGLRGVPRAGDDLLVVESEERAKDVVDGRIRRAKAQALVAVAAADAIKRDAERKLYTERRQRKMAYLSAVARQRRRAAMAAAGVPTPADLVLQPWETAILAEGLAGRIEGLAASGKKLRTQGDQQLDVTVTHAQADANAAVAEPPESPSTPLDPASGPIVTSGPRVVSFLVKTDSAGSLVALEDAFTRISAAGEEVVPRIAHAAVGEVSERDVDIAADMGAVILAFNAKIGAPVTKLAERRKARIITGRVIYALLDEVCDTLAEHLAPESREEELAVAEVKAVFDLNARKGAEVSRVAGCVVTSGTLTRAGPTAFRLLRIDSATGEPVVVATSATLASLMHLKDKVESVTKGTECGIALTGVASYAVGDRIVAVKATSVKRKLLVRFD